MVKMLKKVIDYPITLDSFAYNAREFVNNIFVGPQGQLLEALKEFNTDYNTNIGVTKNFTLKPGAYDLIKKAYAEFVLRWDMKPRGIESIFRRIGDYRWRERNFQNDINTINNLMSDLKLNGLKWQDNTEDLSNEIERLKSNINSALEDCKRLYPDVDIDVKMIPIANNNIITRGYNGRISFPADRITEPLVNDNTIVDYIVTFVIYIKKPIMTIHAVNTNNTIDIQNVQSTGDIIVFSGARMLNIVSRCWGREVLLDNNVTGGCGRNCHYLDAAYLDSMNINQHPYISNTSDKYAFDLDPTVCNNIGNICTGNMAAELRNTILNGQIMAHIEYIYQWLTNYYIPQTNPLNRIHKFRRQGRNIEMDNIAADYSSMRGLIEENRDPYSCTLSEHIYQSIRIYSKKRTEHDYSSRFAYSRNNPEFVERSLEYINHIDIQDLPCNECVFDSDCEQANNIKLFLQDTLSPMEEAYLGMFIEIREFEVTGDRDAIHFVEELIIESFRHTIDLEHDKLLLAYQISKKAINDERKHVYTDIRFLDYVAHLRRKEFNDLEALITLSELELQSMSLAKLSSYKHKLSLKETPSTPGEDFNDALNAIRDELDEEALRELTIQDIPDDSSELTDEERTLRWASQLGGAANL